MPRVGSLHPMRPQPPLFITLQIFSLETIGRRTQAFNNKQSSLAPVRARLLYLFNWEGCVPIQTWGRLGLTTSGEGEFSSPSLSDFLSLSIPLWKESLPHGLYLGFPNIFRKSSFAWHNLHSFPAVKHREASKSLVFRFYPPRPHYSSVDWLPSEAKHGDRHPSWSWVGGRSSPQKNR